MAGPGSPLFESRHDDLLRRARLFSTRSLSRLDLEAEHDLEKPARSAVRLLAREGFLKALAPRALGGAHETVEVRAIAATREGIAYGSGLADAMLALQGLGSLPLTFAGSPEQRKEWIPRVVSGRAIAAFAVTEPEAGSDVASMTTRARAVRRGWEITGTKTFISNAGIADYYALFAKTDPSAGSKGIGCFLVPKESRGLKTQPLRLLASHPVGTLRLSKVRLPAEALVGGAGDGLRLAFMTLDVMRPTVAAAACGFAHRALDEAVARSRSRKQFGQLLGEHQGIRWRLAEASTELEAARLLVRRAAWLKDHGQERITTEAAQAKLFATEAAQRIVDLALQVHGGSGTVAGSIVERLYREVRALRIYEGTSEILREVIGRGLLSETRTGRA